MKNHFILLKLSLFLLQSLAGPIAEANLWQERQVQEHKTHKQERKLVALAAQKTGFSSQEAVAEKLLGFSVPQSLGSVVEAHRSAQNSGPVWVHIQDMHGSGAAQQHSSQILSEITNHLSQNQLTLPVYVEGTWGNLDARWLSAAPSAVPLPSLAQSWLRQGQLNGEEFLALTQDKNRISVVGIENAQMYQQNLAMRQTVDPYRYELLQTLSDWDRLVQEKYFSEYPQLLRQFLEQQKGFLTQGISADVYAGWLLRNFPDLVNARTAPELTQFCATARKDQERNRSILEAEITQITKILKSKLSGAAAQEFTQLVLNYRLQKVSASKFYQILYAWAQDLNLPAPEMGKLLNSLQASETLSAEKVNAEIIAAEQKILSYWKRQQPRWAQSLKTYQDIVRYQKFFAEHFSPADWHEYQENPLPSLADLRTTLSAKMKIELGSIIAGNPRRMLQLVSSPDPWGRKSLLQENRPLTWGEITLAQKLYYKLAFERNRILTENAFAAWKKLPQKPPVAVLIAGGFHTDAIEDFFKKNDFSYVVLRPNLSGESLSWPDQNLQPSGTLSFEQFKQKYLKNLSALLREVKEVEERRALKDLVEKIKHGLGVIAVIAKGQQKSIIFTYKNEGVTHYLLGRTFAEEGLQVAQNSRGFEKTTPAFTTRSPLMTDLKISQDALPSVIQTFVGAPLEIAALQVGQFIEGKVDAPTLENINSTLAARGLILVPQETGYAVKRKIVRLAQTQSFPDTFLIALEMHSGLKNRKLFNMDKDVRANALRQNMRLKSLISGAIAIGEGLAFWAGVVYLSGFMDPFLSAFVVVVSLAFLHLGFDYAGYQILKRSNFDVDDSFYKFLYKHLFRRYIVFFMLFTIVGALAAGAVASANPELFFSNPGSSFLEVLYIISIFVHVGINIVSRSLSSKDLYEVSPRILKSMENQVKEILDKEEEEDKKYRRAELVSKGGLKEYRDRYYENRQIPNFVKILAEYQEKNPSLSIENSVERILLLRKVFGSKNFGPDFEIINYPWGDNILQVIDLILSSNEVQKKMREDPSIFEQLLTVIMLDEMTTYNYYFYQIVLSKNAVEEYLKDLDLLKAREFLFLKGQNLAPPIPKIDRSKILEAWTQNNLPAILAYSTDETVQKSPTQLNKASPIVEGGSVLRGFASSSFEDVHNALSAFYPNRADLKADLQKMNLTDGPSIRFKNNFLGNYLYRGSGEVDHPNAVFYTAYLPEAIVSYARTKGEKKGSSGSNSWRQLDLDLLDHSQWAYELREDIVVPGAVFFEQFARPPPLYAIKRLAPITDHTVVMQVLQLQKQEQLESQLMQKLLEQFLAFENREVRNIESHVQEIKNTLLRLQIECGLKAEYFNAIFGFIDDDLLKKISDEYNKAGFNAARLDQLFEKKLTEKRVALHVSGTTDDHFWIHQGYSKWKEFLESKKPQVEQKEEAIDLGVGEVEMSVSKLSPRLSPKSDLVEEKKSNDIIDAMLASKTSKELQKNIDSYLQTFDNIEIGIAKHNISLKDLFDRNRDEYGDLIVSEGYTLRVHTIRVIYQYMKYFYDEIRQFYGEDWAKKMIWILALHDIGKVVDKDKQHSQTQSILRQINEQKKIDDETYLMAMAMNDRDFFGELLNPREFNGRDEKQRMNDFINYLNDVYKRGGLFRYGISIKQLYNCLCSYYFSDASSYTDYAGGIDEFFPFLREDKKLISRVAPHPRSLNHLFAEDSLAQPLEKRNLFGFKRLQMVLAYSDPTNPDQYILLEPLIDSVEEKLLNLEVENDFESFWAQNFYQFANEIAFSFIPDAVKFLRSLQKQYSRVSVLLRVGQPYTSNLFLRYFSSGNIIGYRQDKVTGAYQFVGTDGASISFSKMRDIFQNKFSLSQLRRTLSLLVALDQFDDQNSITTTFENLEYKDPVIFLSIVVIELLNKLKESSKLQELSQNIKKISAAMGETIPENRAFVYEFTDADSIDTISSQVLELQKQIEENKDPAVIESLHIVGPVDKWEEVLDRIEDRIEANIVGWSPDIESFQHIVKKSQLVDPQFIVSTFEAMRWDKFSFPIAQIYDRSTRKLYSNYFEGGFTNVGLDPSLSNIISLRQKAIQLFQQQQ